MSLEKCPVAIHAELSPHSVAIFSEEKNLSYRQLDHDISCFCRQLDYPEGSRVAFIAKNHWRTISLFFAIFRKGLIACPLSFRLPKDALKTALERLKPVALLDPLSLSLMSLPHSETEINAHLPATLLFTSGTTATPKIACHSLNNYFESARNAFQALNLSSESCWHLSLPLFHVGGLSVLFRCFLKGASVSLSEKKWASHLSLVPTQLYRLLQQDSPLINHASYILLGGAAAPPTILKRAAHLPIHTTYGMTEMSSLITLDQKILPGREVRIGPDYEIFVRGNMLFLGYWENGQICLPVDQEGWFATKDLGILHSQSLQIIGRKDHLFISGGENIQPEEVEQAVLHLPGILQAYLVPIPDEEFGVRGALFIQEETPRYTLTMICDHLRKILPGFKLPVKLLPLGDLEGKISRFKLREIACASSG